MSNLPVAKGKSSLPKPSLSQIATATGSQLDLLVNRAKTASETNTTNEVFSVGDRVWVGGSKLGIVRFIGDTKFAPGEWAGVELDESQGKNDGSVGGEVYFHCSPLHGVFSRCNRLSRKQSVVLAETTATMLRRMSRAGGSASPTTSLMDLANRSSCSPPPSTNLSPAESTCSLAGSPLQVGDRVIVASSMAGTKTGTLRYLGPTDFAKGEWAGVELDAAIGKNDGTVDDKRYFTCDPNFGLFAPLHKVTKSPKMKMMKPIPITPAKLRRESSNLSDISMTSVRKLERMDSEIKTSTPRKSSYPVGGLVTPATVKSNTTALKDLLKEKEAYIEQLLKEREMERWEVAKAASQTDEAETKLAELRQQFDGTKEKNDERYQQLSDQLEEEKRKTDDLQFRLEEEKIINSEEGSSSVEVEENLKNLRVKILNLEEETVKIKEDKEGVEKHLETEKIKHVKLEEKIDSFKDFTKEKGELQDKITILNKELSQEQKRCENFETEANKVFEAEEQLMIVNEELTIAKKKFEEAAASLNREVKLKEDLLSNQHSQDISTSEKIIKFENEYRGKEGEIINLRHDLDKFKNMYEESEKKYSTSVTEVNLLKKKLQESSVEFEKQDTEIQERSEKANDLEMKVSKLTDQLTMTEELREKETSTLKDIESVVIARDKEIIALKDQLDQSGSECQKDLQAKIEEVLDLSSKLNTKNSELENIKSEVSTKEENIVQLNSNLEIGQKSILSLNELKENLEKESETLKLSIKSATDEVERLTDAFSKKDEEIHGQCKTISLVTSENDELRKKVEDQGRKHEDDLEKKSISSENEIDSIKKSVNQLEKELEISRKEVSDNKTKSDFLQKQITETHQVAFSKITKTLESKDSTIYELESKVQTLREESLNKDSSSDSILNELKQLEEKLKFKSEEFESSKCDLEKNLNEKEKGFQQLEGEKKVLETQILQLNEVEKSYSEATTNLMQQKERNDSLKEEKIKLEAQIKDLHTNSTDSSARLDKLSEDNCTLSEEVSTLKDTNLEVKQKSLKLQNELDQLRSSSSKEIEVLQTENVREVCKLQEQIESLNKDYDENMSSKTDIIDNLNSTVESFRKSISELKVEKEKVVISSESEISKLNIDLNNLKDKESEKDDKIENLLWKKGDLEKQLEKLREEHEEEIGEMVDVVNDLKLKEDELSKAERDLKSKTSKIDDLCKQLLHQEQSHKDIIKKKEAQMNDELKIMTNKIEESKNHVIFLKDQMGSTRVENDLNVQKVKSEHEVEISRVNGLLDQKSLSFTKIKEDLANKEEELEFIKEELETKRDELDDIASDLDIKEASFSNETKEIEEKHQEEIEELITKNEKLNVDICHLKETIAKQTAEFDTKMDEILKSKKTEINSIKDQLSEKEISVMDLEANLKTLEDKMHNMQSTMEGEISLANTKIDKISGENESLRRTKYELENSCKNVTIEKDHVIHINEDLSIRIVEFEVQVKEMKSQYESLQVEHQKQSYELKEKIEKASQDMGSMTDMQHMLDNERSRVDELQLSLNEIETERDGLVMSVTELEATAGEVDRLSHINQRLDENVTDLNRKNEFLFEEIAKERLRLESKIEILAEALEDKKKEYSIKEFEVSQLQSENSQLSSYKRQVLTLEQEKRDVEAQLATVVAESRVASKKITNHNFGEDGEFDQFQMQVEFLNSVIVDMQKKNDDLKMKLELYESAGILDESVEFMFNGVSSRAIPPRLFCDICDQFDLHDTEDCPTQATPVYVEEKFLEKSHSKKSGKRGEERAYCETCEVFGHTTESCDSKETF